MVETYYVTKNSEARSRERARVYARSWSRPKGNWRTCSPSAWPRLWGAVVMEALGLLPVCSNHEAALTTLSIYPYSSTKFQMAFSFVYIFLDRRSITRSKYATNFTFGIPLNFSLFFLTTKKLSAHISTHYKL